MGYEDNRVNIFEKEVEGRLERELERMLRFKKAQDAVTKNQLETDKLFNRKELQTIVTSGINDDKLMDKSWDAIKTYQLNNPGDARYANQLSLDLTAAEDLYKEKTNTRIGLNNALNKIAGLDPTVQTKEEDMKSLLKVVDDHQQRASELGMNAILSSSNTRENELMAQIKNQNNINKALDGFLKFLY